MATSPAEKAKTAETSDLDDVMEHVRAIKKDFAALATATGALAARQAKAQSEKAGRLAGEAAERAATYRDVVADKVREHPFAAIGIGALAGLVIAGLRKR